MSQALMDYVTARHEVIREVLELLAAEQRLSDENSSALDVTRSEEAVDEAARRLAEAADALPLDRKPVGWSEPPAVSGVPAAARRRVAKAVLRVLSAQYADESACADAEAEYADEQLALAARNLAADVGAHRASRALPVAQVLPVEWQGGAA